MTLSQRDVISLVKIYAKKGSMSDMPDIPENFKKLYDSEKILILLKGERLNRKKLISKCERNRTFEDYYFSKSTYYKWIREWINLGLIHDVGEGSRKSILSLTDKGKWVTDANNIEDFHGRLGNNKHYSFADEGGL